MHDKRLDFIENCTTLTLLKKYIEQMLEFHGCSSDSIEVHEGYYYDSIAMIVRVNSRYGPIKITTPEVPISEVAKLPKIVEAYLLDVFANI